MKKIMLIFMLIGMRIPIHAQVAKPVTISGQLNTDKDSVKLIVWFAKNPIVGFGEENEKIDVPVGPDGKFSFSTPPISHVARLSILDAYTRNQLFTQEQQIITPGDQVKFFANIHSQGDPYYFKAVFFGKGAAKYECIQALKAIDMGSLDKVKGIQNILHLYDSLLNSKQKILANFQGRLTMDENELIEADVVGELKQWALVSVCGSGLGGFHMPRPDAQQLADRKRSFDALMEHLADSGANQDIVAQSVTYRKYLYERTRSALVFENNGEPVSLKQLFQQLRDQYSGLLREKLLGMLFLNNTENYFFFGGIDPNEYRNCLQEAYTIVQTPDIKDKLKQYLDAQSKGAPAFNFILPVDSSATKKISLSDLKGKVVLLDLWSYQCTGCMMFSQTFHKKIYPLFRNNPEFVVASIMLGETNKTGYMRRLHSEGGAIYTYPEYLNLFGGKGIVSAKKMAAYHNIDSYPTILLLDKQGRIYSSTLPVIYGDPRNKELEKNVNKLTDLIKKALAEPGIQ